MTRYCYGLSLCVLAAAGTANAGIDTPDPYLAGAGRNYHQTNGPTHYATAAGFFDIFVDFDMQTPPLPQPPVYYGPAVGAPNEIRESPTLIRARVSLNGLPPGEPVIGSLMTIMYHSPSQGHFDTEMLAMNIQGLPNGVMIRESPTLQSTGQTSVTPIPGGLFHIDSFFDVFTELSIDGGASWNPSSNGPMRLELPAPGTGVLMAFGGILASRRRR